MDDFMRFLQVFALFIGGMCLGFGLFKMAESHYLLGTWLVALAVINAFTFKMAGKINDNGMNE